MINGRPTRGKVLRRSGRPPCRPGELECGHGMPCPYGRQACRAPTAGRDADRCNRAALCDQPIQSIMPHMSADGLKIAMLAPVSWPVPPESYGPWEQVCANICEELVRLGHKVTLFAACISPRPKHTIPAVRRKLWRGTAHPHFREGYLRIMRTPPQPAIPSCKWDQATLPAGRFEVV